MPEAGEKNCHSLSRPGRSDSRIDSHRESSKVFKAGGNSLTGLDFFNSLLYLAKRVWRLSWDLLFFNELLTGWYENARSKTRPRATTCYNCRKLFIH